MEELICNLHMHSIYSDGTGDYTLIGHEALKACLDVAIITDHNVPVKGLARYIESNRLRALLATGQALHDHDRTPPENLLPVICC